MGKRILVKQENIPAKNVDCLRSTTKEKIDMDTMKLCPCNCGQVLVKRAGKDSLTRKYATKKCWARARLSGKGNLYDKGKASDKLFNAFLTGDEKVKAEVNSRGARITYWWRGGEEFKTL